jgi:hypothetical protein
MLAIRLWTGTATYATKCQTEDSPEAFLYEGPLANSHEGEGWGAFPLHAAAFLR